MEQNVLVSVVMPNYNGARFIGPAIESVLKQTYRNIELIIVDDHSSDTSFEIIQEYCKEDSRVSAVKLTKNSGVAVARNIGIGEAQGQYIALLDSDDVWEKDKIELQLNLAITKGSDLVYCSYDFINENGLSVKKPFIVPGTTDYKRMLSVSVISCSTVFARAKLLKDHPFSTHYYHEDYLLWMQLLKLPLSVAGSQKVLAHYRQVSGARSSNKKEAAKERWNIYRKALGMNAAKSIYYFIQYSVHGVIKYI